MEMRAHQAVGLAAPSVSLRDAVEEGQERKAVVNLMKDVCTVDRTRRDVKEPAGDFFARRSRHEVHGKTCEPEGLAALARRSSSFTKDMPDSAQNAQDGV